MVLQPSIRALQRLEITHTLNRWILHICPSNLLPQTFRNANRNSDWYNKNKCHYSHPFNPENQRIKSNIPRAPWGSLTKISEKIWWHSRPSSINIDTYNPYIINSKSANTNTLSTMHTKTHQKIKHTRYNSIEHNTSIEHTIDTTFKGFHHTDFIGWVPQHAIHATA